MRGPEPANASAEGAESEIGQLLAECGEGKEGAFERLFALVYDDLRTIARRRLGSEREGHTLDTSSLVHESYLALAGSDQTSWQDRAHFLAVASRAMRRILVDHARKRLAAKRGGDPLRVTLHPHVAIMEQDTVELLAIDDALSRLASRHERLAKVVECRFFGGMTVKETAEALSMSRRSVERDWTRARAYLFEELRAS